MEREILQNFLKLRLPFQKTMAGPIRSLSNMPDKFSGNQVKPTEEEQPRGIMKPTAFGGVEVKHWNEFLAMRKQRRTQRLLNSVHNVPDLIGFFQNWKNFPTTLTELQHYFKRRWIRTQVAEQTYLPERVEVLRPDLAATHFLVRRGGHVKFLGSEQWVGPTGGRKKFPMAYVPGMFVEAIKAEGTNLIPEGLANFDKLKYLTSLSLRNLESMNDWCMDHISKEHYMNLKHLDISGCKNITYRGLSCFYRFECLETLNVEGIPDPPEFKLACLLLLEVMPDLDIQGIDLTVPQKIDPVSQTTMLKKPDSEVTTV